MVQYGGRSVGLLISLTTETLTTRKAVRVLVFRIYAISFHYFYARTEGGKVLSLRKRQQEHLPRRINAFVAGAEKPAMEILCNKVR